MHLLCGAVCCLGFVKSGRHRLLIVSQLLVVLRCTLLYMQAGPWQYRFEVPFDPVGLAALYNSSGIDMCGQLQKVRAAHVDASPPPHPHGLLVAWRSWRRVELTPGDSVFGAHFTPHVLNAAVFRDLWALLHRAEPCFTHIAYSVCSVQCAVYVHVHMCVCSV